jgi:hypothetical protein
MADLTRTLESIKASFSQYSIAELIAWRDHLTKNECIPIHQMVKELLVEEINIRTEEINPS